MKYTIGYELTVEAENTKKLLQKLSLIEMQIKMKDKHFSREIFDEDNWYVSILNIKEGSDNE